MQETADSLHHLPHAIFIYGTLKRGQPNHYILETFGYHQFSGTGCTELNYPLIIDTSANLPFLLDAPGKGQVRSISCLPFVLQKFQGQGPSTSAPYVLQCFVVSTRIF